MCGRYTLHHDKNVLEEHFKIDFGSLLPRYNLAPTERIKFVFSNADERRQAGVARWGLVPNWSKTGTTETPLFNARSETVLQKPAFRNAFVRGRCLVPASGWYEWRRDEGGKQPYHLRPGTGEPFAFAGLFDVWRGEGDKRLVSCTILTTAAPRELRWLHERMPVVMDYDHYDRWLDRTTPDVADLTELLTPYPAEELEIYPVSPKVNRADTDEPALLEAVSGARASRGRLHGTRRVRSGHIFREWCMTQRLTRKDRRWVCPLCFAASFSRYASFVKPTTYFAAPAKLAPSVIVSVSQIRPIWMACCSAMARTPSSSI